jgi:hypothetical protein
MAEVSSQNDDVVILEPKEIHQVNKKPRNYVSDQVTMGTHPVNITNRFSLLISLAQQNMGRFIKALQNEIDEIKTRKAAITSFDPFLKDLIESLVVSSSTSAPAPSMQAATCANLRCSYISVNFGGKCLTLDRNVICNPKVKYNFFSALFHPRWQRVLPKDQAGRLYFELEYKWIQPILDAYEVAYFSHTYTHSKVNSISLANQLMNAS